MQEDRYIATADLGSSKIGISVAKVQKEVVEVIYYKETPSDGIRNGSVFNPMRASAALRAALDEAEKELHIKILQIVTGLPRGGMRQESNNARTDRSDSANSCITREEIDNLKNMALDDYPLDPNSGEKIYGAVAQSFSADSDIINASETDIVGTTADVLEGNFKIFIGPRKALDDQDKMLNDADVACARKYFIPSCVAKAVLSDEEKENGVALIEMGAGVTSVTIYHSGILRSYSAIPFGGKNITADIKYECGFKESLAENIKLAFGACLPEKLQSLEEKILQINDDENGTYDKLPVKYLSEIISSRAQEIIQAILFLIQDSGYADKLRNGVVITGGCANLTNLANMIKEMSGYNVRTGYPRIRKFISAGCPGLGETAAATSVGLLMTASLEDHLNCTSEVETPVETENETVKIVEENSNGSLFADSGDVILPDPKKKKKDKGRITWGNKIGKKFSGVFDSTVGNLFDTMEQ